MWVEDIVSMRCILNTCLLYEISTGKREIGQKVMIYTCHHPWVNDSPLLVSCGRAVAGGNLRRTVGT